MTRVYHGSERKEWYSVWHYSVYSKQLKTTVGSFSVWYLNAEAVVSARPSCTRLCERPELAPVAK
jgi:hypothetical protein